jgi:hypothetical protein
MNDQVQLLYHLLIQHHLYELIMVGTQMDHEDSLIVSRAIIHHTIEGQSYAQ